MNIRRASQANDLLRHTALDSRRGGFSLLELLICVAIIGVLMALSSQALSKAFRAAKQTAAAEGMHQEQIAGLVEGSPEWNAANLRNHAREKYRKIIDTGKQDSIITELVFHVHTDEEFRAYWHTLLNPERTENLEFTSDGRLIATDDADNTSYLVRMEHDCLYSGEAHPSMWDYLSTSLSDMSTGSTTIQVLYLDGDIQKIKYGRTFPATRTVADLGHRYMLVD